jgi:hypothetical protein
LICHFGRIKENCQIFLKKGETKKKGFKILRIFISGLYSQIWRELAKEDHLPLWLHHKIAPKKKKKKS